MYDWIKGDITVGLLGWASVKDVIMVLSTVYLIRTVIVTGDSMSSN